jgi:hypothetical protein
VSPVRYELGFYIPEGDILQDFVTSRNSVANIGLLIPPSLLSYSPGFSTFMLSDGDWLEPGRTPLLQKAQYSPFVTVSNDSGKQPAPCKYWILVALSPRG